MSLGGHVQRTANLVRLFQNRFLTGNKTSKPKIAYFPFGPHFEHIGWFNISMHNKFLFQVFTTWNQLFKNLSMIQNLALINVILESTSFTIISD